MKKVLLSIVLCAALSSCYFITEGKFKSGDRVKIQDTEIVATIQYRSSLEYYSCYYEDDFGQIHEIILSQRFLTQHNPIQ